MFRGAALTGELFRRPLANDKIDNPINSGGEAVDNRAQKRQRRRLRLHFKGRLTEAKMSDDKEKKDKSKVHKLSLKGSSKLVAEFFNYSINTILFQRGVYPAEDFTAFVSQPYSLSSNSNSFPE